MMATFGSARPGWNLLEYLPTIQGFGFFGWDHWPCQPQLAPRFSFDLAPRSVAWG